MPSEQWDPADGPDPNDTTDAELAEWLAWHSSPDHEPCAVDGPSLLAVVTIDPDLYL